MELWDKSTSMYASSTQATVQISVVYATTQHQLVSQKGNAQGKLSFTAADSGDHHLCLTVQSSGWASSRARLYLDIQYGQDKQDKPVKKDDAKKSAYADIIFRIKDLQSRVKNIRNELEHQRDREKEFRNHSERLNSSAIRWTLAQLLVLGITCVWQLRYLKQFFLTKKLV